MDLFDLHCDTLYECYETGASLRENTLCIDRAKTGGYGHYAQFFALFCGAQPPQPVPGRRCLMDLPPEDRLDALLDTARTQFRENANWLTLCRDADELELARRKGKAAAFLSVEGAELLPTEAHVQRAYDAGVRLVTLSWNYRSPYACGAVTDDDAGLTPRGRALVHELIGLGVILDVSHLSSRGFWELCVETEAPFAATHSNSRAVCGHTRNLTDDQFRAIRDSGGVVGINLYNVFVGGDRMEDLLAHFDHFLELGGEKTLALGSDWDGDIVGAGGIRGVEEMHLLAEAMARRGYGEKLIRSIFYDNLARLLGLLPSA